jgi:cytochrome c oxidase subunit 2
MAKFLGQWMPIDASAHGKDIDRLIIWTHWLMLMLFVVWGAYFLYVLWRFNAKRSAQASYRGAQTHVSTYAEAGVALVEVVLLVGFSIPAWYHWTQPPGKEVHPLEIRVVGEQFAWNVQYPGVDGVFGRRDVKLVTSSNPLGIDLNEPAAKDDIVTLNQLHLEQDRDTIIHVSSKDVIHSFKLVVMRAEQDAIPGMDVKIHFKPVMNNENGEKWEIACAQLCGLGHYRMRGEIHVHRKAEFDKWLTTEPKAASSIGS